MYLMLIVASLHLLNMDDHIAVDPRVLTVVLTLTLNLTVP